MFHDEIKLACFIIGFIGLGIFINHTSNLLYWFWIDWRNRKDEDR